MVEIRGHVGIHRFTESAVPEHSAQYSVTFGLNLAQPYEINLPVSLIGGSALVKFLTQGVGLNYRAVNPAIEKLETEKSAYIADVSLDEEKLRGLGLL